MILNSILIALLGMVSMKYLSARDDAAKADMPLLNLPYGTWRATHYSKNKDIYTFRNVRYAAPPVGELRWQKPQPPEWNATLQDGSYGPGCFDVVAQGMDFVGPLAAFTPGYKFNEMIGGLHMKGFGPKSEDCLFMDIYVPGKALKTNAKLPVIVYLFGGAFEFGGKTRYIQDLPLYDGSGVIQQSGGEVIFISFNHRLGAFGWLAGTTMEDEALPNAGLWDQRAVLQWVKDYAQRIGGDPENVSFWGVSSGAASIMHHLVAYGGNLDPLFHKAVIQSPAYMPMIDRRGLLEEAFQNFTSLAGCQNGGLSCLRAASTETLVAANADLIKNQPRGAFSLGASVDGKMIRQAATLELNQGNYWKNLSSLILSHTSRESNIFVDGHIHNDTDLHDFILQIAPTYSDRFGLVQEALDHYPSIDSGNGTYKNELERSRALINEYAFVCNTRYLMDAYNGKTWNFEYAIEPGYHATDTAPLFFDYYWNINLFGKTYTIPIEPTFGGFAKSYQSYLSSHARVGNPNTFRDAGSHPGTVEWPRPDNSGDAIKNVLQAHKLKFRVVDDGLLNRSTCDFWIMMTQKATLLGEYAPRSIENASSVKHDF